MVVKDSSKQHPAPSVALKHLTEFTDIDKKLTRNLVSIVSGIWGLGDSDLKFDCLLSQTRLTNGP